MIGLQKLYFCDLGLDTGTQASAYNITLFPPKRALNSMNRKRKNMDPDKKKITSSI
jgi:hypothetical protein